MRSMRRNKRKLYLCNRYQEGLITKYGEPIELDVNYQATNSEGDLIALGLDFPMYIRIKTDLQVGMMFNANDRVYIIKQPSADFDGLCKDADYEVDSDPILSLNSVEITLKKLSGK
jgi:hypothetical protein